VRMLERRFDPAEDGISLAGFLAKGDPADWEKWEWPQRPEGCDSL
jgi:hypothetical protein